VHIERFARPGAIMIADYTHTTTSGLPGMLAIGAGELDAAIRIIAHRLY
jgi:homoaconitase/3-isopropylmalate dehydratase large subunit